MSLWGNRELFSYAGTVSINLSTGVVTGTATTFSSSGVSQGDVIVVGAGATYGQAVISTVTSNTVASVASTQYLIPHPTTGIITAASYYVSQKPIYTLNDSNYAAPDKKINRTSYVSGYTAEDQTDLNAASDNTRKYASQHAGWVGVTTYTDTHGNLRVKTETLVAGSSITYS